MLTCHVRRIAVVERTGNNIILITILPMPHFMQYGRKRSFPGRCFESRFVKWNETRGAVTRGLSRCGLHRYPTLTIALSCPVLTRLIWQVFQTFSCEDLEEIDKSYLRADFRIECYTPTHRAFEAYASVMIILCEYWGGELPGTHLLHGSIVSEDPKDYCCACV